MIITCLKGHKRNSTIKDCAVCLYGSPPQNIGGYGIGAKKKDPKVGQGSGGGPKKRKLECKQCHYVGFAIKNYNGNSQQCAKCGKRR